MGHFRLADQVASPKRGEMHFAVPPQFSNLHVESGGLLMIATVFFFKLGRCVNSAVEAPLTKEM